MEVETNKEQLGLKKEITYEGLIAVKEAMVDSNMRFHWQIHP